MPYTYKKEGDKYVVYKKDTGKKIGSTKGTKEALKKYMAALHLNTEGKTMTRKQKINELAKLVKEQKSLLREERRQLNELLEFMDGFWFALGQMGAEAFVGIIVTALAGLGAVGVYEFDKWSSKIKQIISDRRSKKGAKEAQDFLAKNTNLKSEIDQLMSICSQLKKAEKSNDSAKTDSNKEKFKKLVADLTKSRKDALQHIAKEVAESNLSKEAISYLSSLDPYMQTQLSYYMRKK